MIFRSQLSYQFPSGWKLEVDPTLGFWEVAVAGTRLTGSRASQLATERPRPVPGWGVRP